METGPSVTNVVVFYKGGELHRLGLKPHREGLIRFVVQKVTLVVLCHSGDSNCWGLNCRRDWGAGELFWEGDRGSGFLWSVRWR